MRVTTRTPQTVSLGDAQQGSGVSGRTLQLHVDWTRCDGHGLCAALAPDHVSRDEWGFPVIAEPDIDSRTGRAVVNVCPALALRLEPTDRQLTTPTTGSAR